MGQRVENICMSEHIPLDQLRPLSGRAAWIFSDGKSGHELQCLGVAEALRLKSEIKRVHPRGLYRALSPWAPVAPRERFGQNFSDFAPPWPAIAFATGRTTIPYIRALKKQAGSSTYTVILMDPRVNARAADLLCVPEHDQRRGDNVVTTLTAPHRYSPQHLAELRAAMPPEIAALPAPRIAVLIGGPNGAYRYDPADIVRLTQAMQEVAETGASLMITPSRRTPGELLSAIASATQAFPRLFWDGGGGNPYPAMLANAGAFIVTADSVNMAGEAAATGKPIHIFTPSGGSEKFARFHAALEAHGATRPLGQFGIKDTWVYQPLDSATIIAEEIQRRWLIRAGHTPGLTAAG